jgi:hypothetical protein
MKCPWLRLSSAKAHIVAVVASLAGVAIAAEPQPFTATPLDELGTEKYRGQQGGLYGQGRNVLPAEQQTAADRALAAIRPLDATGRPAAEGRIVLLGLGMSNTAQEFAAFQSMAAESGKVPSYVVLVNGAQGGCDARAWAAERSNQLDPWHEVQRRLAKLGVTSAQVQCIWIKQALARPGQYGAFPAHAAALENHLVAMVTRCRAEYSNLRLVYMSSRTYGGHANTRLNPEPYAYESAFAVRRVIERQMAGDALLNFNPARGKVVAPVVLWGPYLWANGDRARKEGGLTWTRDDVMPDGTHPSPEGCRKIGKILLDFLADDPRGPRMFVAQAGKDNGNSTVQPQFENQKRRPVN